MEHNDIRHKLSEYIDGAVTAEERAAIEAHIAACAGCSDALRELRKTVEHLRASEEIEPPPWLTQKIMAQVREAAEGKKSFFRALQKHFALLRPIRVVIVLFLVVTAYSVYMTVPVREKLAEPPVEVASGKASPDRARQGTQEQQAPQQERVMRRKQKLQQEPAYRSLDMKYSYEKPALPEPAAPAETESLRAPTAPEQSPQHRSIGAGRPLPPPAAPMPPAKDKLESEATGPSSIMRFSSPAEPGRAGHDRPSATEGLRDLGQEEAGNGQSERRRLIEHFLANDLPADGNVIKPVVSVRPVLPASPELRSLGEPVRTNVQLCGKTYLVEWEIAEKIRRYYYCYGPEIVLLGKYEFSDGKWIVTE